MDATVADKAESAIAIQTAPPEPAVEPLPFLPPPRPTPSVLIQACPRPAQWTLAGLLLTTIILLAAQAYGFLPLSARPSEFQPGELLTYRLELNKATKGELMQLPGIGPKLADRIIDYRDHHGPFRSMADLSKISGFGPATLKRLEGWVYVDAPLEQPPAAGEKKAKAAPAEKPKAAPKIAAAQGKTQKGGELKGKINLNTASAADLQKLPRIGPVLSLRIVEERAKKPFQSVDDLKRVKGIGQKTLDNLRPYVTVGE